MAAKYSKLPQEDTEAKSALDFDSVFTYDYPKYFSYGEHSKKYRSAFSYPGGLDMAFKKPVLVDSKPSVSAAVVAGIFTVLCYMLFAMTLPISWWFCVKKLSHYERIVLFRLGKLLATKGPGRVLVFPCIDQCKYVDLRLKAFSVPPQTIMTLDAAHIQLGADVYHHIKDAVICVNNVQDLNQSIRNICPSIMQKHMCKLELSEIENGKAMLSETLLNDLNKMTLAWGVEVTKVELSAIKILVQPDPDASMKVNPSNIFGKLFSGSGNTTMSRMPGVFPADSAQKPTPVAMETLVTIQDEVQPKKTVKKFKSAEDLLTAVQPHLSAELVREFNCVYKFIVTGKDRKVYVLDLKHGTGSATREAGTSCGEADVTVTLTAGELRSLLNEETTPFGAYMTGKLQLDGDTGLASKLSELIAIIKQ